MSTVDISKVLPLPLDEDKGKKKLDLQEELTFET
jgi:hypothetical protein